MSKHRVQLHGSKKKSKDVDPFAIARFMKGEATLVEALKLDEQTFDGLRRQAHALFDAGKWQQCIDVVRGLAALGDVDPFDPFLLAGSYRALGDDDAARIAEEVGERMLVELE